MHILGPFIQCVVHPHTVTYIGSSIDTNPLVSSSCACDPVYSMVLRSCILSKAIEDPSMNGIFDLIWKMHVNCWVYGPGAARLWFEGHRP